MRQREAWAPLKDGRHWLKPPISTGQAATRGRQTAPVVGKRRAFQAQPPVVVLAVAQGEAFGQVFGVGRPAHASEPRLPRREGVDLGIIPAASVAFVALLGGQQGVAAAPWRWWLFAFGLLRQHQCIAFGADRRAVVVG